MKTNIIIYTALLVNLVILIYTIIIINKKDLQQKLIRYLHL